MAIDSRLYGAADPVPGRPEEEARGGVETLLDPEKVSS